MPRIRLAELETVMAHYRHIVSGDVVDYPDTSKSAVVINNARQSLQRWFAQQGVELTWQERKDQR